MLFVRTLRMDNQRCRTVEAVLEEILGELLENLHSLRIQD